MLGRILNPLFVSAAVHILLAVAICLLIGGESRKELELDIIGVELSLSEETDDSATANVAPVPSVEEPTKPKDKVDEPLPENPVEPEPQPQPEVVDEPEPTPDEVKQDEPPLPEPEPPREEAPIEKADVIPQEEPLEEVKPVEPVKQPETQDIDNTPETEPHETTKPESAASNKTAETDISSDPLQEPVAAPQQARIDAPPKPNKAIRPEYPRSARRRGEQGDVLLELSVSANGSVDEVRVIQSTGFADLDAAATKAVKAVRFTPAESDGRPIAAKASIKLSFKLK